MMMKYALTLSRWHKVAERINTALKERETSVKKAFTATTVSPWNKEGIEEKAAGIARRAADDLALIETAARAVAQIRAALAIRNAELGISARLAEAEAASRTAALYKSVVEGQDTDMVRPESVRGLPVALVGETDPIGFGRRSAATVTLQTADGPLVESLRERLAREQARATRLLDEVADLNREKLEIDVPREMLEIAGLAA
jgi:hypothetical protein